MAMPGLMIEREILIEAPAEVVWRTIAASAAQPKCRTT